MPSQMPTYLRVIYCFSPNYNILKSLLKAIIQSNTTIQYGNILMLTYWIVQLMYFDMVTKKVIYVRHDFG